MLRMQDSSGSRGNQRLQTLQAPVSVFWVAFVTTILHSSRESDLCAKAVFNLREKQEQFNRLWSQCQRSVRICSSPWHSRLSSFAVAKDLCIKRCCVRQKIALFSIAGKRLKRMLLTLKFLLIALLRCHFEFRLALSKQLASFGFKLLIVNMLKPE